MPPLKWDLGLQQAAETWVQHLHATRKLFADPNNKNMGESRYFNTSKSRKYLCVAAVDSWYFQIDKYAKRGYCSRPPYHGDYSIADFVQLMWKNTKDVGIAISGDYVVARFAPRGNIPGQVAANVNCPLLP
ncbi:predicted protein [Nematostella vectensis]|uniref:SCP domain-containing protein n=2 Tax=Nematostella vectensis TaxID=45351 RepID=A7SDQ2_NEMVE|nr:predicted protein [Nematostella vectensis]|eukprot:XP_001630179.1 predicted protein [Nematostella vectensis]